VDDRREAVLITLRPDPSRSSIHRSIEVRCI
jgi:hypothetical protein